MSRIYYRCTLGVPWDIVFEDTSGSWGAILDNEDGGLGLGISKGMQETHRKKTKFLLGNPEMRHSRKSKHIFAWIFPISIFNSDRRRWICWDSLSEASLSIWILWGRTAKALSLAGRGPFSCCIITERSGGRGRKRETEGERKKKKGERRRRNWALPFLFL